LFAYMSRMDSRSCSSPMSLSSSSLASCSRSSSAESTTKMRAWRGARWGSTWG
jgi:hypothetical protein